MTMPKPHDPTDLMFAPVALAIDARLEELARLDRSTLEQRITLETNMITRSRDEAERAVLAEITYLIPTHGWEFAWDARGIRMSHEHHTVVLGVPDNLRAYVEATVHPVAATA
jgi:hypothetical protein